MKYLFIILIAFSFIGCDGEDVSPNSSKTIYATFQIPTNTSCWLISGSCQGPAVIGSSGSPDVPLPSGTTVTTDPVVLSFFPTNAMCSVTLTAQDFNDVLNTEVEIKLYVDDQLYETRVVTGQGNHNFIVE